MYLLFSFLIALISVALIFIIMIQNPKGGGLSSSFGGGGSQMFGVQSTNKFLDNATWTLAIALFALSLFSNFLIERGPENIVEENRENLKEEGSIDASQNTTLPIEKLPDSAK